MKKVILLNSPPYAGKDFTAKYIFDNFKNIRIAKFSAELKERTHKLYGFNRPWNYYEHCKDKPNADFYNSTPRQAYINVSQKYFKPCHGEDIFGRLLAKELDKETNDSTIVISDSGFVPEANVLIKKYGADNVTLVRIHRQGCTFESVSDSRSYIYIPGVASYDVINTLDDRYLLNITNIVKNFIKDIVKNNHLQKS